MVNQDGNDGSSGMRPRSSHARTPRPRSREGTQPPRVSLAQNVATPFEVWRRPVSRPQVKPNPSEGTGRSKKRRPPAERHGEPSTRWIAALPHAERRLT